ncbi:MAG: hypothetical protein IPI32_04860 [Austwickia sp.]|nr:hypothetical protein [Austwickia sp.]MBK8436960.1 hypothetical protein [Austwickia sp.]MBK9100587.1 hypothetical protein [Austwickia sp.]
MGWLVFGLVTVLAVAALVVWWAVLWEKNTGGLDERSQARVEALERRSASAAALVRGRVAASSRPAVPFGRPKRLKSKASPGAS